MGFPVEDFITLGIDGHFVPFQHHPSTPAAIGRQVFSGIAFKGFAVGLRDKIKMHGIMAGLDVFIALEGLAFVVADRFIAFENQTGFRKIILFGTTNARLLGERLAGCEVYQ
ncbi:MAG: hypothetical protein PVG41_10575 [Desulfobacteraceae bacterium]|jgi:hypothetical protein